MLAPFALICLLITFVIIMWILSDPNENTRMFLGIPSIAVLIFSYIVLGTDWTEFGRELDSLRMFFAGLVAIPYVISSGVAFFIRVYSYMLEKAREGNAQKSKRRRRDTSENPLYAILKR